MILKMVHQTKIFETHGYCLLFFRNYEIDKKEADKEKVHFFLEESLLESHAQNL